MSLEKSWKRLYTIFSKQLKKNYDANKTTVPEINDTCSLHLLDLNVSGPEYIDVVDKLWYKVTNSANLVRHFFYFAENVTEAFAH